MTIFVDESGKKKKKLNSSALQLVTVPVVNSSSLNTENPPANQIDRPENAKGDRANDIHAGADRMVMPDQSPKNANGDRGNDVQLGADQMVMADHSPESQVPVTTVSPNTTMTLVRRIRSARTSLQMYAGIKGCRYDEIFYGKTRRGEEVQIDVQYEDLGRENDVESGDSWVVAGNTSIGNG